MGKVFQLKNLISELSWPDNVGTGKRHSCALNTRERNVSQIQLSPPINEVYLLHIALHVVKNGDFSIPLPILELYGWFNL